MINYQIFWVNLDIVEPEDYKILIKQPTPLKSGVFYFFSLTNIIYVVHYTMNNLISSQGENTIMNKKTERKNKTNQVVSWPSRNEYFTIDSLIKSNQHMLTSSGSDITLRVRLSDAITKKQTVAPIGTLNCGKGRPKLAFAMTPVTQTALDKAKAEGIILLDESKLIPIMEIKSTITTEVMPVAVEPVKVNTNTVSV